MGPGSRTPSGPAVLCRLHQQAGQKTAPDQHARSAKRTCKRGGHPQRIITCYPQLLESTHVEFYIVRSQPEGNSLIRQGDPVEAGGIIREHVPLLVDRKMGDYLAKCGEDVIPAAFKAINREIGGEHASL